MQKRYQQHGNIVSEDGKIVAFCYPTGTPGNFTARETAIRMTRALNMLDEIEAIFGKFEEDIAETRATVEAARPGSGPKLSERVTALEALTVKQAADLGELRGTVQRLREQIY